MDRAAVVAQPWKAIGRQKQLTVEIDDLGLLRHEQRRCDRQRCADRAADHNPEAAPFRFGRQREALRSVRRPCPGAPFRRGDDGTGEGVGLATRYFAVALVVNAAAATVDHRKSVPSTHMRCMTTASRHARATLAAFTLPLFAIRIAQDLSEDQRP
jgi:hypothetical protein